MMLGKYDIKIEKDGKFKVPKSWSEEECQGLRYNVYKAKEHSLLGETVLIYRFDDISDSDYEFIASYKFSSKRGFLVPPKYREAMQGECVAVGIMDHFSLHKKSEYKKAFAEESENIAKLLDELGF